MAFTDAEKVNIRRYCGYGPLGKTANPAFGDRYMTMYGVLEYKMQNLQPAEEDVVRNVYLANLSTLESDIPLIRQNLDTKQAAVWFWNEKEHRGRDNLFDDWRNRLCGFLGLPPGPYLQTTGSVRVIV